MAHLSLAWATGYEFRGGIWGGTIYNAAGDPVGTYTYADKIVHLASDITGRTAGMVEAIGVVATAVELALAVANPLASAAANCMKPFSGKTKTNGLSGGNRRFYERDHTHGDVEVYDARRRHLGSANPETGAMTTPSVPGRSCEKYPVNRIEFCCERMTDAISGPEIPIVYVREFREFGIRVLDGGSSFIELSFCPWCGQKLPKSLRDRWFDELERRGIDPATDEVPAEFTDDRWYKVAGDSHD
jgi:hypothetical protein